VDPARESGPGHGWQLGLTSHQLRVYLGKLGPYRQTTVDGQGLRRN